MAMGFEEFALTEYWTAGSETVRPSRYGAGAWRAGYAISHLTSEAGQGFRRTGRGLFTVLRRSARASARLSSTH